MVLQLHHESACMLSWIVNTGILRVFVQEMIKYSFEGAGRTVFLLTTDFAIYVHFIEFTKPLIKAWRGFTRLGLCLRSIKRAKKL